MTKKNNVQRNVTINAWTVVSCSDQQRQDAMHCNNANAGRIGEALSRIRTMRKCKGDGNKQTPLQTNTNGHFDGFRRNFCVTTKQNGE